MYLFLMGKSAYNFFVAEKRVIVKEENPTLGFGEVSKKVGEMWKALTDEEKKPYQEMADKAKEEEAQHPKEKKEKKDKKDKKTKTSKKEKKEESSEEKEESE